MIFSGLNLLYYLLHRKTSDERSIIDHQRFFDGQYCVIEGKSLDKDNSQSKNHTFDICEIHEKEPKEKFFLKQCKTFEFKSILDIDNEVRALKLISKNENIKHFLPNYLDAEYNNGWILFDYEENKTLKVFSANNRFLLLDSIPAFFIDIALILRETHATPIYDETFREFYPQVLSISENFINNIVQIKRRYFDTPEKDEFAFISIPILEILRKISLHLKYIDYASKHFIHSDVHFGNFLVIPGDYKKTNKIKLIDWELACIGDKYWDIAKIIYIIYATTNTNGISDTNTQKVKKIIQDFWLEYHRGNDNKAEIEENAIKVVQFILLMFLETEVENLTRKKKLSEEKLELILEGFKTPKNFSLQNPTIVIYELLTSITNE